MRILLFAAYFFSPDAWARNTQLVFSNYNSVYCPYTLCEETGSGYIPELVKKIFSARGYEVIIRNEPWTRALALAEEGTVAGVLSIAKESSEKMIFPEREVAQFVPSFYTSAKSSWKYDGESSLQSIKFGLVKGYGYGRGNPVFGKFLESDTKRQKKIAWITGDNTSFRILRMLESGRIDATIEDSNVVDYYVKKAKAFGKFKQAGPFTSHSIKTFVGFAPHNPESIQHARMFDEGLDELRKTGQLKTILDTYGIQDWAHPL